jgi:transposase-like protein
MRPGCIPQSKPGYAAMPGKKLTEEKRRRVIAALNANSNATAVAREIGGISAAGVWKIAKRAGIELTAGIAARGCNNRVPPEKRAEIVAALNVNPNATAVAREVGGVSGVGVWKIAQVEGIELRHSSIDQARRRRGRPAVHHAFGAGLSA